VCYEGEGKWKKVLSNTVYIANTALFNTVKTGEYAVLVFAVSRRMCRMTIPTLTI